MPVIRTFILPGSLIFALTTGDAIGATASNLDEQPQTIVVTERGGSNELTLSSGETLDFCMDGCFVTFPNGDKEALTGSEHVEISGGKGKLK